MESDIGKQPASTLPSKKCAVDAVDEECHRSSGAKGGGAVSKTTSKPTLSSPTGTAGCRWSCRYHTTELYYLGYNNNLRNLL